MLRKTCVPFLVGARGAAVAKEVATQSVATDLSPELRRPDPRNTSLFFTQAEAEAKAQRRRSSNAHQFLSTAAERAVASSSLLPGTAEGGQGAIAQFKEGFQRFKSEVISQHREFFRDLASAQSPQVMVIACCDSRVDPALLLGASPGDIFIVRNIANLVPPFERQGNYHGTSAALEYAVRNLKVRWCRVITRRADLRRGRAPLVATSRGETACCDALFTQVQHIMILGHKNCGGVRALMGRADASKTTNDFIDKCVRDPADSNVPAHTHCSRTCD